MHIYSSPLIHCLFFFVLQERFGKKYNCDTKEHSTICPASLTQTVIAARRAQAGPDTTVLRPVAFSHSASFHSNLVVPRGKSLRRSRIGCFRRQHFSSIQVYIMISFFIIIMELLKVVYACFVIFSCFG